MNLMEDKREAAGDVLSVFTEPTAKWFADAFGRPTRVQEEAWPAIAAGKPVLVSAPTGTGKTLSAFLVFIDRLKAMAREDVLEQELYLLYVSPLKSLAGDIRENLRRPLDMITREEEKLAADAGTFLEDAVNLPVPEKGRSGKTRKAGRMEVEAAIRTGDTPQRDRQRMVKHPPHILIITPESLYLMLTSKSGQSVLKTARAVIVDELHALIDTKRGAHLMLSLARLDKLCGRKLQRIGLSATIEPLELAAKYLSPEPAVIAAPSMEKKVRIEVWGTTPAGGRRKDPVWEELAAAVYQQCQRYKSVIAFTEGRRYAEKLAYYVKLLGGEEFASVHHGSLSKEQRAQVEDRLREGHLRLLCATSSMELGIDVGDIDLVLQVGCPRTISSTMQRLGRAGHNPGRVSLMYMYPRTAPESIYCGMTAQVAREGGVEHARPPRMCLDVLAQHLVSMAAGGLKAKAEGTLAPPEEAGYTVDEVMEILARAYSFQDVTREDVKSVLSMLAGDYEHRREIPVRPRLLYDRIHERVQGDVYSRMLAVAAGGTIPDKGLYTAKTQEGVTLGELDEEFVYETRIGDKILLGAFGWRVVRQDRDTVVVEPSQTEGARLPFWKGETKGRALRTSLAFGRIMRQLYQAGERGCMMEELGQLGLDESASVNAMEFLNRQIAATQILPDDRTILIEHFQDHTGCHQVMVHSLFGRQVNAPLAILMQQTARTAYGVNIGCVDEEDGFLLYPYGEEKLPEGMIYSIDPKNVRGILEAVLPATPIFSITFRYNAARALMMGMHRNGRQPLWMQRLKSTELLDSVIQEKDHPLIRETRRECLEEQWDLEGVLQILAGIRSGQIAVREVHLDTPSPMSLPFQWQIEAAEMYEYYPATQGIRQAVYDELGQMEQLKPSPEELARQQERGRLPEDEQQLHSLLMMEGDLSAEDLQELGVPVEWLVSLACQGRALYREPGLWIAAEQREEYERALEGQDPAAGADILRRMLYYRGGQPAGRIRERYFFTGEHTESLLSELLARQDIVEDEEVFYHARRYSRARKATIRSLRLEAVTQPPERYASLMASRAVSNASPREQLEETLERYRGCFFPASSWETVILARRVKGYKESMLDQLLAQGDYFWRLSPEGSLCFCRYEEIDWEAEPLGERAELEGDELTLYRELKRRGACFLKALSQVTESGNTQEVLLSLAQKGLVCADSYIPVRQWLNRDKTKKATARQRVNVRVMALSAGRWDIVRPLKAKTGEEELERMFGENILLTRETFRKSAGERLPAEDWNWGKALEFLRIWEYTGRVRRGYFVSGMSGAQFLRNQDYEGIVHALSDAGQEIIWLNAADPAQIWGKALEHTGMFLNVPGTVVALLAGKPAVVLERQGKTLRVLTEDRLEQVMMEFVRCYLEKRLFPENKRLIVKEYPAEAIQALKAAGFLKEMQDYVLYR